MRTTSKLNPLMFFNIPRSSLLQRGSGAPLRNQPGPVLGYEHSVLLQRSQNHSRAPKAACPRLRCNSIRRAVPHGTKIRMQPVINANALDQIRRVRIQRRVRDVLVPRIVEREKPFAMKTRARSKTGQGRGCLCHRPRPRRGDLLSVRLLCWSSNLSRRR